MSDTRVAIARYRSPIEASPARKQALELFQRSVETAFFQYSSSG